MPVEQILASIGLGDLVIEDFFLVQVGVLAATIILLVVSLIFVLMAFKAARSAKGLESGIEDQFHAIKSLAAEMHELHDQTLRNVNDYTTEPAQDRCNIEDRDKIKVGASQTTPEAEIEVIADLKEAPNNTEETDANLSAARDGVSVPSALLRGLFRKKR